MADRKRTRQVNLRLSDDEFTWLAELCEQTGLSQSDWIRQAIRKAAEKLKK